ncbi:purine-binding chemotaxis protein CheW [Parapusillimonas sp. SGNA-6]|nr:purine-binding chemotaxis protein CheW [Parapusillimonas sp. SGNA-6]
MPPTPRLNDCWNQIGIRGDGSCPELQQHIHCRNCPVYREAATRLLDRAAVADGAGIRSEASSPSLSDTPRLSRDEAESILVFRIGSEWLGLHSAWIKEIVEERRVHSLPQQRNAAVLGIVNIRGALVLCVSLATLLHVDEPPADEQAPNRPLFKPMVVTSHGEHTTVFPVDEVHGVHRFSPSTLTPVPSTIERTAALYTRGILPWDNGTVGVLDGDSLFQGINRSIA